MELIPAIDLLDGRVVRLVQGDFERSTSYGDDPLVTARRWVDDGARRLHLVDLDGARSGRPVQHALIERIVAAVDVPCQVAGGLRDGDAVAATLEAGADRAVLGTAVLTDPMLARTLVDRFGGDRIVAALDVRDGAAVGEGWRQGGTSMPIHEAAGTLRAAGIIRFAVTAIDRDGGLAGPDLVALGQLRRTLAGASIIASGGITTVDDLRALIELGMEGAILGRALYEGRLDLREALAVPGAS